jgi:hypothetical protein
VIHPPLVFPDCSVVLESDFKSNQFLGRPKVQHVDGRVGRSPNGAEVDPGEGDRDDVVLQDVEVLLCDVVVTHRVLEGQVEFVSLKGKKCQIMCGKAKSRCHLGTP